MAVSGSQLAVIANRISLRAAGANAKQIEQMSIKADEHVSNRADDADADTDADSDADDPTNIKQMRI